MNVYTERKQGSALADFVAEHAQVLSIALFFLLCMAIFGASSQTFLTTGNLLNILRQAAPILIVAVAMTLVITTAGIDLSVGSQVALVNAVCAIAIASGLPWPVVVVAMLLLGGTVGAVQGWFIAYQGIPAFIVTLAGLSILRGIALYLTEGYSIPITGVPGFLWLGRGTIGSVPVPAILALLIAARLGSGSSNAAQGFELQVIAAVVLGGTSLMGGKASMLGTVLGTMTIAVIGNGLILLHISPFFTQIVTGAIILIAIWLNTRLFDRGFRFGRGRG